MQHDPPGRGKHRAEHADQRHQGFAEAIDAAAEPIDKAVFTFVLPVNSCLVVEPEHIARRNRRVVLRDGQPFLQLSYAAQRWEPKTDDERNSTGVMIGSGIGGLSVINETSQILKEKGPRRVSPFFIPASLINLASGQVAIKHGFKGPNHAVVTACASGAHAIGDAARMIMLEDAEVMIAGGAESALCRLGMAGFAQARAMRLI